MGRERLGRHGGGARIATYRREGDRVGRKTMTNDVLYVAGGVAAGYILSLIVAPAPLTKPILADRNGDFLAEPQFLLGEAGIRSAISTLKERAL